MTQETSGGRRRALEPRRGGAVATPKAGGLPILVVTGLVREAASLGAGVVPVISGPTAMCCGAPSPRQRKRPFQPS